MIGSPEAGEKILFVDNNKVMASACASIERGR